MNVDILNSAGGFATQQMKSSDIVDIQRKQKESTTSDAQQLVAEGKVQPEELLDQIKAITENGLYSVRFEKDEKSSEVVVKIFDNNTQEVIRQFPAEELINFKASFKELVGNFVDTEG